MEPQANVSNRQVSAVFLAAALFMSGGLFFASHLQRTHRMRAASARIASWPQTPFLAAKLMLERYGPPDRQDAARLVWLERAPWKRVEVLGSSPQAPLRETVAYRLTPESARAAASLGHGVEADSGRGELSAAGASEGQNFLALNLANEIAFGVRDAAEARAFYEKTESLAASGKASPYMQTLFFKD